MCIYGNADMHYLCFCPILPLCQVGTHRIASVTPTCEVTRCHKLHLSVSHPEDCTHTQARVGPGLTCLHHHTPAQQHRSSQQHTTPLALPPCVTQCHTLSHANTPTPFLHSSHLSPAFLVNLAGLVEGRGDQQEREWPCLPGG